MLFILKVSYEAFPLTLQCQPNKALRIIYGWTILFFRQRGVLACAIMSESGVS